MIRNSLPLVGGLVGASLLWWAASVPPAAAAAPTVDFQRDVRSILSDKCFQCHGPDEETREADLRFDRRDGAAHVLAVPGEDVDDSELMRRILSSDPDERMPPPSSKLKLEPSEIATLRRWIAEGGEYTTHWSFRPLVPRAVPDVGRSPWPRNEIDAFVWKRLQAEGRQPAPEASRRRLLRRLCFDLTGLPPSLELLERFLADERTDAYERVVDQLLDSSAYGERMASDWLDVARYSDSYGYQVDRDRFVWPWRDWVLRSFNQNLSYDKFITYQLAGDLLPSPTDDQILATTFCRLHPQKVEGGSVPEEFRVEYVADRTHTFGTAMLGLTLECCRCHDHKFDPITQREYYQLFAFFNNIDEAGLYSYFTESIPTPTLLLAKDEQKKQLAASALQIAEAEKHLEALIVGREAEFETWLSARDSAATLAEVAVDAAESQAEADRQTASPATSTAEIPGEVAHHSFEDYQHAANRTVAGKVGKAVQLTGDDGIGLKVGNFSRFEPFSISLWINSPDLPERAVIFHRSRAWTDAASRGYELLIEEGKLSAALIHFWPGNALRIKTQAAIPTNEWLHVTLTYDGSSRAAGLKIYLNGQQTPCDIVRDNLSKNITGGGGDNITIGERFRDRGFTNGLVDEFRVFSRELSAGECEGLFDAHQLHDLLRTPTANLSTEQRALLRQYYFAAIDPAAQAARDELKQRRLGQSQLVDGIQEIMVMRELNEPRPTYLLRRGAYDAPTDRVPAETPAILPPLPAQMPRNRLALAAWLTDPQHPLTARVAVNHYWQVIFGDGLVRTPEDFGSQGQPPAYPDLLDWLAQDFVRNGWDLKRLLKVMVMSATYRQDSLASAELYRRDPENLLLARGSRYRLPAEMIRDNALATSGLLVDTVGGPPVKPYELTVAFLPYDKDQGPGLYRRSLYTFWKRNGPAPVMMTLDAAKRDVCTVRRERTASPLQALVLLNGPQVMEASRVLAQRVLRRHGERTEAAIEECFERLTSRPAEERETALLNQLWNDLRTHYREQAEEARQLLAIGDSPRDEQEDPAALAAMTMVVNTLMNFDECVTRR